MQNKELTPPEQYRIIWLLMGSVILLLVILLNAYIFYATRKKKIRTVSTIPVLPPVVIDLNKIKQKYFSIITQIETQYHSKVISQRTAHQLLSTTLRLFVYEIKGLAVHKFTLSEIKRADLASLAAVIEVYYPPEFSYIESSDADSAIALARKLVQEWS